MPKSNPAYRKSYRLITIFIVLVSLSLTIALFAVYRNTQRSVLNQFKLNKSEVLDSTIRNYNRLIEDSIPLISYYKGYLDSSSFFPLARRYFKTFDFIDKIVFYNMQISNRRKVKGLHLQNLTFSLHDVIEYKRGFARGGISLYHQRSENETPPYKLLARCSEQVYNYVDVINDFDTTRSLQSKDLLRYFYKVSDLRISYMNVPGKEEIRKYRELMVRHHALSEYSEQDLVFFELNPQKLRIVNINPALYEKILLRPLLFDSLANLPAYITTTTALPKAFSDYELYLYSSLTYLHKEIMRLFLPNALILVAVHLLTLLLGYLIYRNLRVNNKLFKLQYDFINNFTHEFKTPVSVIKIAGNNIRTSELMNEDEQLHYGRILDEEADKLNELMNRLLSFTQLENKSFVLKRERIPIGQFCDDVTGPYKIKHPDFEIACHIENVNFIIADKVLLKSIFINLVDNAYKYSHPGNRHLDILVQKVRKSLFIKFTDRGIGIPQKEVKNIFNKFYKVENEFNQQGSVGIGLAFCKAIVQFLEGELTVKSEVGKGTEFLVKLPYLNL